MTPTSGKLPLISRTTKRESTLSPRIGSQDYHQLFIAQTWCIENISFNKRPQDKPSYNTYTFHNSYIALYTEAYKHLIQRQHIAMLLLFITPLPQREVHSRVLASSLLPHLLPIPASFSSSSSSSSSSLWLQYSSSDSNPAPVIPKLARKPKNAMPPNTPQANASPFGRTCVAREKRPPERKGPTARPAADSVCARPLSVPRTEWFGAEFVI